MGVAGRGNETSVGSSPTLNNSLVTSNKQVSTDAVQTRKANTGIEKEILARMKVLEKASHGFINRMGTQVYLSSKEEIAFVHLQNESMKITVPPDIIPDTVQKATDMEEESVIICEDNRSEGKLIPGNSESKNSQIPHSS
ncbi:hypothetical protein RIF29_21080 [Crotalaria pallida]|uniref:Uncharacterized protein n=1 Tax=Crotalaria pallida TaxID=3830 RepID=A0AAN9F266_CROPI